jgi:hypothetical protein
MAAAAGCRLRPSNVAIEAHPPQYQQRPDGSVGQGQGETGHQRRAHEGEALERFDNQRMRQQRPVFRLADQPPEFPVNAAAGKQLARARRACWSGTSLSPTAASAASATVRPGAMIRSSKHSPQARHKGCCLTRASARACGPRRARPDVRRLDVPDPAERPGRSGARLTRR